MFHVIRQLEEKNVATEIDIMLWSDRMDLVAFSNTKGEVALHRLTWTRAWSLAPNKEGSLVKGMSWRPDGKVLAVAYSSGHVLLINVENKTILHTIDIMGTISCIVWAQEKNENKSGTGVFNSQEESKQYMKYIDYSSVFLPDLPSLSSYSTTVVEESTNTKFFQNQNDLNLVLIGTEEGFVHFSIFGCLPCAIIDVNKHIGVKCSVLNIHLSENLNKILVTVKDIENNVKLVLLNADIFQTHTKELFAVAYKHERLNGLISYLNSTITTIKEIWESVLLEMDAKLSNYASKVPEGTLSADFLDLLMFGISSDEMQEFLLRDLTKKGLEKFGQTIELSYANIQKLLLKNITKVGQNVTYHLAELRGMARLQHRYKILGLREDKITEGIAANGSFLIKSGEMQQIINNSMLNYKAFFRWLYTAIIHLMDETVPPEIPKMTQQDLAYITEFLQNFDDISAVNNTSIDGGGTKCGFIMERVGQYLADAPLTIFPNLTENVWDNFLLHNTCVGKNPTVFSHHTPDTSLVQQFNLLQKSLAAVFDETLRDTVAQVTLDRVVVCCELGEGEELRITQVNTTPYSILTAFLPPTPLNSFYLLSVHFPLDSSHHHTKAGYIHIPRRKSPRSLNSSLQPDSPFTTPLTNTTTGLAAVDNYAIVDVQFYTAGILSVLMQESVSIVTSAGGQQQQRRQGVLYQLPVEGALCDERLVEVGGGGGMEVEADAVRRVCEQPIDGSGGLVTGDMVLRHVQDMVVSRFAVSGARKVAIVLAENRRKVRIYEMEGEEEEEEDEEDDEEEDEGDEEDEDEQDEDMQENSDIE